MRLFIIEMMKTSLNALLKYKYIAKYILCFYVLKLNYKKFVS